MGVGGRASRGGGWDQWGSAGGRAEEAAGANGGWQAGEPKSALKKILS